MAIYLRRATLDDLQSVMTIIEPARAQLKEKGNPIHNGKMVILSRKRWKMILKLAITGC